MNQYGGAQDGPYTGQHDSTLVENPRYQGQSTGTAPQGATGPQQESRYGAAPLSSTGLQQGQQHVQQQHGTGQGGYGTSQTTGGYGSDPNAQAGYGGGQGGGQGYGSQTTGGYGSNPSAQTGHGSQMTSGYGSNPTQQSGYGHQTTGGYGTDPSARGTQTGYGGQQPTTGGYGTNQSGFGPHPTGGFGPQTTGGYGTTHQQRESEFAKEQPGYGQPGFGAPSEGHHTGDLWPQPATPPNAHQQDLTSQGQGGYGQQHQHLGQGGYVQQHQQSGQGGYGQQLGQGEFGQQHHQPGQGPYGQGGYDQPPRKEGIMDKMKDAVGMGPQSYSAAPEQQQGYNPNVNHPSETTGFGGGLGHHPHAGQDQSGGGYNTGLATGAAAYSQSPYTQSGQPPREGIVDKAKDAVGMGPNSGYTQSGQPPREGIMDKAKDAVGMGPNSGYNTRTQTGNDAYVHGNHPAGMQDRVQGVNEPSLLGGEHGAGRMDERLHGETRTEPGYDSSKGHLSGQGGHHQSLGDMMGGHHNTGTGVDERREKGFEDTTGPYDSKLGTGSGTGTGHKTGADAYGGATGTGTGHKTGADAYGEDADTYGGTTGTGTGAGTGYDDTTTDTAPPKKGLMSKIKEKMHH